MRFSLRLKLALLSLLLLLFPLLGMRLNNTLKNSLITSQKDTLSLTAQAVSAALTDRNDLFDREQFHGLNQDRDLYLFQLSNIIRLDGRLDDWWPELSEAEEFGREHLISSQDSYISKTLNFRHLAGKQDKFLYAGKHDPSFYLNPLIRSGISSFSALSNSSELENGLKSLENDVNSGAIGGVIESYNNDLGDYMFIRGIVS